MVSKTALHALKAFVILAGVPDGSFLGTAAIAGRIGAPRNYLGKLLQSFSRLGLLDSQKGLTGGFRLTRPAATIPLIEVVDPIDHASRWDGCFLGHSRCSERQPCAAHARWSGVRQSYLAFLRETSIADLVE